MGNNEFLGVQYFLFDWQGYKWGWHKGMYGVHPAHEAEFKVHMTLLRPYLSINGRNKRRRQQSKVFALNYKFMKKGMN